MHDMNQICRESYQSTHVCCHVVGLQLCGCFHFQINTAKSVNHLHECIQFYVFSPFFQDNIHLATLTWTRDPKFRPPESSTRIYQTCLVHPLRPFYFYIMYLYNGHVTSYDYRWFRFDRYIQPVQITPRLKPKKAFYRLVKYCSFDMTRFFGVKMLEHVGRIM